MYIPGRGLFHRYHAGCLANLWLKLVSLVIAVILYVYYVSMHHMPADPRPDPPAAACPSR